MRGVRSEKQEVIAKLNDYVGPVANVKPALRRRLEGDRFGSLAHSGYDHSVLSLFIDSAQCSESVERS